MAEHHQDLYSEDPLYRDLEEESSNNDEEEVPDTQIERIGNTNW